MSIERDRRFMERALAEARQGRPRPNPHVGAVIARGDEILAVGHHRRAGEDHAEVAAIRAAGTRTSGATLYCTLEPCNHFGRTPPCTDAIVQARLARVVVGCADPAPHVPGATGKLRAAGIEVTVGVLEEACREMIADFARHITTGLPYVVLKAAVTLDGRLAARTGDSKWITGEASRAEAHRLRDRADAVLVGVGTVLADDPSLTVRHVPGHDPIRVVWDTHLRTPATARLLTQPSEAPTWIIHGPTASSRRRDTLAATGAELVEVPLSGAHLDPRAALEQLGRRDIVRLLVEGGAQVHGALLREGLVQAGAVFVAPRILGDPAAPPLADAGPLDRIGDGWWIVSPRVRQLGDDVLFEGELAKGHP